MSVKPARFLIPAVMPAIFLGLSVSTALAESCPTGDPPCVTAVTESMRNGQRFITVHWSGNSKFDVYHLQGGPRGTGDLAGSNRNQLHNQRSHTFPSVAQVGTRLSFSISGCVKYYVGKDRCTPFSNPVTLVIGAGDASPVCTDYANKAISSVNQAKGCDNRLITGPRWDSNREAHLNFCAGANPALRVSEERARAETLNSCRRRPNSCAIYSDRAVVQFTDNVTRKCGYTGPAWHKDFLVHHEWCIHATVAGRNNETTIRNNMLLRSPPCESLNVGKGVGKNPPNCVRYPSLPGCTPPAAGAFHGAIAFNMQTGGLGIGWNFDAASKASDYALDKCGRGACKVFVANYNSCSVLIADRAKNITGFDTNQDRNQAQEHAMKECQRRGGNCKPIAWVCTGKSPGGSAY